MNPAEKLLEVDPPTHLVFVGFFMPTPEMGDFVRVKKAVMELETLLNLRFSAFRHKDPEIF